MKKEMKKALTDKDKNTIRDYLRQRKDTWGCYIAISAALKHKILVSEPAFRKIHNNFKKSRKAGTPFDKAANKLIIDLQNSIPDFNVDDLSKSIKKVNPMEIYKERQDEKERACLIFDIIQPKEKTNKIIASLPMLISYKSYLTESERERKDQQESLFFPIEHQGIKPYSEYGYICQILGIPFSKYHSSESLQEDVSAINTIIVDRINILNYHLDRRIAKLLAKSPETTKKWFIDVFKESSERYIPEWREISDKRARNITKKDDYGIWKRSLQAKTKTEVGVKREAGTRYHDQMIRGEMFFLKQIHYLLYGKIDKERKRFQKMLNEVFTILDECSITEIVVNVIPQLQARYKTKGNYLDPSQNRNHFLPFKDLTKYDKLKPKT